MSSLSVHVAIVGESVGLCVGLCVGFMVLHTNVLGVGTRVGPEDGAAVALPALASAAVVLMLPLAPAPASAADAFDERRRAESPASSDAARRQVEALPSKPVHSPRISIHSFDLQSRGALHRCPSAHGGQNRPPQSVDVSSPLWISSCRGWGLQSI